MPRDLPTAVPSRLRPSGLPKGTRAVLANAPFQACRCGKVAEAAFSIRDVPVKPHSSAKRPSECRRTQGEVRPIICWTREARATGNPEATTKTMRVADAPELVVSYRPLEDSWRRA